MNVEGVVKIVKEELDDSEKRMAKLAELGDEEADFKVKREKDRRSEIMGLTFSVFDLTGRTNYPVDYEKGEVVLTTIKTKVLQSAKKIFNKYKGNFNQRTELLHYAGRKPQTNMENHKTETLLDMSLPGNNDDKNVLRFWITITKRYDEEKTVYSEEYDTYKKIETVLRETALAIRTLFNKIIVMPNRKKSVKEGGNTMNEQKIAQFIKEAFNEDPERLKRLVDLDDDPAAAQELKRSNRRTGRDYFLTVKVRFSKTRRIFPGNKLPKKEIQINLKEISKKALAATKEIVKSLGNTDIELGGYFEKGLPPSSLNYSYTLFCNVWKANSDRDLPEMVIMFTVTKYSPEPKSSSKYLFTDEELPIIKDEFEKINQTFESLRPKKHTNSTRNAFRENIINIDKIKQFIKEAYDEERLKQLARLGDDQEAESELERSTERKGQVAYEVEFLRLKSISLTESPNVNTIKKERMRLENFDQIDNTLMPEIARDREEIDDFAERVKGIVTTSKTGVTAVVSFESPKVASKFQYGTIVEIPEKYRSKKLLQDVLVELEDVYMTILEKSARNMNLKNLGISN